MNRRWLVMLLGILGIVMIYEILNNQFSFVMLTIGILIFIFRGRRKNSNHNTSLLIGAGALVLALISSRVLWLFLVVVLVLLIGEFPELFKTIREAVTKRKSSSKSNEFIMVRFNEEEQNTAKIVRNRWLGDDTSTADAIYSWEDINFSKFMGDTIFDLGNTILPKGQNVILIRKGFGHTKIIVPEGVAISLDISMLFGELEINQEEVTLRNETFKWYSKRYAKNARKIKLVANVLIGEVEVIFL